MSRESLYLIFGIVGTLGIIYCYFSYEYLKLRSKHPYASPFPAIQILIDAFRGLLGVGIGLSLFGLTHIGVFQVILGLIRHFSSSQSFVSLLSWVSFGVGGFFGVLSVVFISPYLVRILFSSQRVKEQQILKIIEECLIKADVEASVFWLTESSIRPTPQAMVLGITGAPGWLKPTLFISRSLPEQLSTEELKGVILHEVGHLALDHVFKRLVSGIVLTFLAVGVMAILLFFSWMVFPPEYFYGIGLMILFICQGVEIYCLKHLISFQEMAADQKAVSWGANANALASALRKISPSSGKIRKRVVFLEHHNGLPRISLWNRLKKWVDLQSAWVTPIATFVFLSSVYLVIGNLWPKAVLWNAAYSGNLERVQRLIFVGVSPNGYDYLHLKSFPLLAAAESNQIAIAKYLLEKGADVNQVQPQSGKSPLMAAAKQGNSEMVELFLKYGADLNAKDREGDTPWVWAKKNGHPEIASKIKNAGSEFTATSSPVNHEDRGLAGNSN